MTLQPNFSTHKRSSRGSANDTFVREGITPSVLVGMAACCLTARGGASVISMVHVSVQASRHADLGLCCLDGSGSSCMVSPRATLPVLVGRGTGIFSEFPWRRYPLNNMEKRCAVESFATICRTAERRFAGHRHRPPCCRRGARAFDRMCPAKGD